MVAKINLKNEDEVTKMNLTDDSASEKSFFRNKKTLFEEDGYTIYIGVSSSTKDKMKHTAELCEFMKEHDKAAHVVWMYNDIEVFDSDNSR